MILVTGRIVTELRSAFPRVHDFVDDHSLLGVCEVGVAVANAVDSVRAHADVLPQWVALDEAHGPIGRGAAARRLINPASRGYLLVTWQPQELSADALASVDAVTTLGSPNPASQFVDLTAAVAELPRPCIARLLSRAPGRTVLAWRQHPDAFTIGSRDTRTWATSISTAATVWSPLAGFTSAPRPTRRPGRVRLALIAARQERRPR